jgi:predicted nucleotidyltransferase
MTRAAHSDLCSTREFARLQGISRQRALALLDAGRVPGARWIGGRWAIPRSARIAGPAGAQRTGAGLARLTPLENALLSDFSARVRALAGARLKRIAVFGSRLRGGSGRDSDLDVAVFLAGAEDRALRARIYAVAAEAASALDSGDPALLQPSVIFAGSPRTGFVEVVEREAETWTS